MIPKKLQSKVKHLSWYSSKSPSKRNYSDTSTKIRRISLDVELTPPNEVINTIFATDTYISPEAFSEAIKEHAEGKFLLSPCLSWLLLTKLQSNPYYTPLETIRAIPKDRTLVLFNRLHDMETSVASKFIDSSMKNNQLKFDDIIKIFLSLFSSREKIICFTREEILFIFPIPGGVSLCKFIFYIQKELWAINSESTCLQRHKIRLVTFIKLYDTFVKPFTENFPDSIGSCLFSGVGFEMKLLELKMKHMNREDVLIPFKQVSSIYSYIISLLNSRALVYYMEEFKLLFFYYDNIDIMVKFEKYLCQSVISWKNFVAENISMADYFQQLNSDIYKLFEPGRISRDSLYVHDISL
eukprot:snap_masked-scaffold_58-processed-gene-0.58-mRNA-1 protein AED:0.13 eAED:1.00 QI:0/0/0/1/1/1/2/0/353